MAWRLGFGCGDRSSREWHRGCEGQFLWLEKWQRWWLLGRKEKRMTNGDQITANGGHGGRQNYVFH